MDLIRIAAGADLYACPECGTVYTAVRKNLPCRLCAVEQYVNTVNRATRRIITEIHTPLEIR
jgi:uncharacterized Zn finger protein